MSPDFNDGYKPKPSHRDLWKLEGLKLPEISTAFYHRDLFEAYQRRCVIGKGRGDAMLCSPREFSIQDAFIFKKLHRFVADDVEHTVSRHAQAGRDMVIEPRFLHHRVIRGRDVDEHHVLVELRDQDLRSVAATRGCVEVFKGGPVALHYQVTDGESLVIYEMASAGAWKESVAAFKNSINADRELLVLNNWAFALMAEGFMVKSAETPRLEASWHDEGRLAQEVSRAIESIELVDLGYGDVFRVRFGGECYDVRFELDTRGSRPIVLKVGPIVR